LNGERCRSCPFSEVRLALGLTWLSMLTTAGSTCLTIFRYDVNSWGAVDAGAFCPWRTGPATKPPAKPTIIRQTTNRDHGGIVETPRYELAPWTGRAKPVSPHRGSKRRLIIVSDRELPFPARRSCIGCRDYQEAKVSSLIITPYIYDTQRLAVGARFSPNFF